MKLILLLNCSVSFKYLTETALLRFLLLFPLIHNSDGDDDGDDDDEIENFVPEHTWDIAISISIFIKKYNFWIKIDLKVERKYFEKP